MKCAIGKHAQWLLLGMGLISLYGPTMARLATTWETDPNYSHGWLVPLVAVWLAWRAYVPPDWTKAQPMLGYLEMVAGCWLHLFTLIVPWMFIDFIGLMLIGRGVTLAMGGSVWARRWTGALAFLFFMFPLPVTWTGAIAVWLQNLVSQISAGLLGLFWVIYQRGHTLYLAGLDQPLFVAEECSGLRQIVAFIALAFLVAQWSRLGRWQCLVLVLVALPCAILANVARVLLLAMGMRWFGTSTFTGWLHDLPALFTLPIGMVLFLATSRWLVPHKPTIPDHSTAEQALSTHACDETRGDSWWTLGMITVLACLAQLGLLHHVEQSAGLNYAQLRQPITSYPLEWHEPDHDWLGQDNALSVDYAAKLGFADAFLHRTYVCRQKPIVVKLYASYSTKGLDREHHPEICVRDAGGGTEDHAFHRYIQLATANAMAERFRFRIGSGRTLTIYYWHYTLPMAEQPTLNWLQLLYQRQKQRSPSLTVQVSTESGEAELPWIEEKLLPLMHRTWQTQLPEGVRVGSDRLSIRWLGRPNGL